MDGGAAVNPVTFSKTSETASSQVARGLGRERRRTGYLGYARRRYSRRMAKQVITTSEAPASPFFSQGVRVGSTVYVSGMTGTDVSTKALAGATIQAQTRQALRNCEAVLAAAGATLADVAEVTVLLTN